MKHGKLSLVDLAGKETNQLFLIDLVIPCLGLCFACGVAWILSAARASTPRHYVSILAGITVRLTCLYHEPLAFKSFMTTTGYCVQVNFIPTRAILVASFRYHTRLHYEILKCEIFGLYFRVKKLLEQQRNDRDVTPASEYEVEVFFFCI